MSEATAALSGDNGGADGGAAAGAEGAQDWTSQYDEDTVAYIQNKGWAGEEGIDTGKVLESYQNLEKFAGGSKSLVELPGADADEDAMSRFYNSLGRPETPDAYSFEMPDGGDSELFGWFRETAHKHGLTDKQAADLFNDYEQMAGGRIEGMEAALKAEAEAGIAELQKEWGKGYDAHVDAGKRAVAALGYDEESLSRLEEKMGTAEMLRLFANVGAKMGEDSFVDGSRSDGSGFGLTPAAARQQISELKTDAKFMDMYLSGDKDAVAKMTRLMEAAHG